MPPPPATIRSVIEQRAHNTAATASPEWRQARDLYIDHLMICRSCFALTGHYCSTGAALRAQYSATAVASIETSPGSS
ncbi:hypothetical protein EJA72_04605 [Pseudomonas sp. PB120]|nr:hypothetical protein [Pseudomonas sp. PB120]